MVSAPTLKKRINELLESSDLNTITERKIKDSLAQEFGEVEIKKHTRAIRNTVEKFLETAGAGDEESEGDDDEADEGGSAKRKAGSQGQPDGKRTKVEGDSYTLALSGMKKLAVRTFKGKVLIDFREYYKDKSTGEEKPGKKGLSLQREQWMALKAALPQLAAALEAGNTDMPHVQIGSMRRAYVSEYK
ncbi:transcriptional Coactivator p15-domain-containing protein [Dunaliella salina]|uniref:Transcriptional Coactivator p15-domain-containing protein n=1 Tax=Dunaliella salina TaxID=3046 RepID=A0ABQ7GP29_DUNSA|nr:transcriptional Coactivator p15-domain-containing protein [Dunaliella salina]|eukprot:KAF5836366.1 transcriptional Coactivator p15-domain-containing protein [Dunaliella salina]